MRVKLTIWQGKRNKKLFWLPAISPLVSVMLSTLIVFLTRADKSGVNIVRHIKGGLNPSSINQIDLNSPHIGALAKIGLVVAAVALTVSPNLHFIFQSYIKRLVLEHSINVKKLEL